MSPYSKEECASEPLGWGRVARTIAELLIAALAEGGGSILAPLWAATDEALPRRGLESLENNQRIFDLIDGNPSVWDNIYPGQPPGLDY
jgi:hypothetical protein